MVDYLCREGGLGRAKIWTGWRRCSWREETRFGRAERGMNHLIGANEARSGRGEGVSSEFRAHARG